MKLQFSPATDRRSTCLNSTAQLNHTTDNAILLSVAGVVVLLHLLTNERYGFHGDELQFLSDARHLDWGFVSYPPFTPFLARISLSLFGLSMVGLRLFCVLAQAIAIYISGLMAREFGGARLAQMTAALAVAFSPLPLLYGALSLYTSFDFLWWVLVAYFIVRLLNSENPRWWLAIGAVIGVGLLTKYTIVFYIAGIFASLALTSARRYVSNLWFWGGVALALVLFSPNLIWLVHHDFISYRFLQHIHGRDVAEGRAKGFLPGQFLACVTPIAAPLWLAGLIGFFRSHRYRMLALMYWIPLALFIAAKGRYYYTAGTYPVLLAMGAVLAERWLYSLPHWGNLVIGTLYLSGFAFFSAYFCAALLPLASNGPLREFALRHNEVLRDEIGWNNLVRTVATIRDSLSPEQQSQLGIIVTTYGEQGAIEILGSAYHLPEPISTINSAWLRGYPLPPPTTLIVIGMSAQGADSIFTGCRLAGHNSNTVGVQNPESQHHSDIFVCGPPRRTWAELWKKYEQFS